jgi:proton-coupled amino acid transporter
MKQPLLESATRSDEFPSPAAPQFQKHSQSLALFRDTAFDFANTLKAFIGANYLAAPYAFYKAGWAVGIVILACIAGMTFHCCALIVRCKHTAAARINARTGEDLTSLLKRLQFPDIGREAFGQPGYVFATAALGISQAGFCIGYFIFMGITLKVRGRLLFNL